MYSKLTLTVLLFALFDIALVQGVDQTLEEKTFGADVADAVVRRITRTGIFPDDQNFFRRVAFTETRFGEDPKTYRPGYYGGIWQVDEEYFDLTKGVTVPEKNIYEEIQTRWGIDWSSVVWTDLLKPFYSGLASRLFIQHLVNLDHSIPGTVDTQAQYWVDHYRKNGMVTLFIREVRALESDAVCEGMMDICIVLDGSGSIGVPDFEKAKGFVADLVKTFSIDSTRVAFLTYGDTAYEIFDFQHSLTNEQMDTIIRNAAYYNNQNTNTPAGLLMAVDFYKAIGSRNGVPQVVATFTDGLYNRGNLPAAITAVKNASLIPFSIGIGKDIDYWELLTIALLNPKRVFMVNDYDALAEFFYHMNAATCEVPQQPALGTNQTGHLNPDERRYFRYAFPDEEGVGINMNIQSIGEAELTGWYSYTETNPNSAVYDGRIQPGSTTIPPPPSWKMLRQEEGDDDDRMAVYITLQCAPGETLGEYVIQAEEGDSQVTDNPTTTEEVPTTTEDVPTTTEDAPTTTEEVPTTTEEVPTTTEDVPTTTEEVPTTTEDAPTTTEEVPTTTEDVPTTTEDVPTTTEDVPTTTEEVPTTTEDVPTTTEEVPTTTEDAPTTTEDAPTTTEEVPTTTEDVPTTTEEVPTTTEEVPTTTETIPPTTAETIPPTTTETLPPTTTETLPPTTTETIPPTTTETIPPTTTETLPPATTETIQPTTTETIPPTTTQTIPPTTTETIPTTTQTIPPTTTQTIPPTTTQTIPPTTTQTTPPTSTTDDSSGYSNAISNPITLLTVIIIMILK